MERIYYAGSSFLTGDDIAQALVNYARFLVAHRSSASVDIPVRNSDGTDGRASFVLGPSSEIVAQTEWSGSQELIDEPLVHRLRDRASGITLSNPPFVDRSDTTSDVTDMGRYFDLYDLREFG
ncbi:hypothetical protein ACLRGF_01740 [Mycetocola zhadangensis]|uniref:hypothetical protein n=1 Tax=Mycetocola zhadangensis TaxID=1164595 RepID=UPI003A4D3C94